MGQFILSLPWLAHLFFLTVLYALKRCCFCGYFSVSRRCWYFGCSFLSWRDVKREPDKEKPLRNVFFVGVLALVLAFPSIFFSVAVTPANVPSGVAFGGVLWEKFGKSFDIHRVDCNWCIDEFRFIDFLDG